MDTIITVPFGYLLDWLYQLTDNFGAALLLFAVVVQAIMLPMSIKSKKSTMKMARLQPRIEEIKRRYAGDQQRQNEAIQKLQKEEGAGMGCGGCLWSLLPLLILIPLYSVVRQPIQYIFHESAEVAKVIVETMGIEGNSYYGEILAIGSASLQDKIPAIETALKEAGLTLANPATLEGMKVGFLGIDLSVVPSFNIFAESWTWTWASIGGLLIPLLSAGQQVLSMFIAQKANNSMVTNDKGLEDKELAKKSQANQTSKTMMWLMPVMSLYIGFTVPCALSLYWLAGGAFRTVADAIMTKRLRKDYDAEDAEKLERYKAELAAEEEKERIRAERRAANPDGITENTSKKKLQKKLQQEEEAAKAVAAKEYAAKRGETEETEEVKALSGVADRPYCKGRAYDPNRYSAETTEE